MKTNSIPRGMGSWKTDGNLGERVPRGIPNCLLSKLSKHIYWFSWNFLAYTIIWNPFLFSIQEIAIISKKKARCVHLSTKRLPTYSSSNQYIHRILKLYKWHVLKYIHRSYLCLVVKQLAETLKTVKLNLIWMMNHFKVRDFSFENMSSITIPSRFPHHFCFPRILHGFLQTKVPAQI